MVFFIYMPRINSELRDLVRIGAQKRIEELQAEIARLRKFAESGSTAPAAASDTQRAQATRRRSKMSPAARKAVSERMKKYWADKRRQK
jgi:hypothetical protein